MSRGAVVYLVISLPATITKLNLSGCRDTLQDEGNKSFFRRDLAINSTFTLHYPDL